MSNFNKTIDEFKREAENSLEKQILENANSAVADIIDPVTGKPPLIKLNGKILDGGSPKLSIESPTMATCEEAQNRLVEVFNDG